MQIFYHLCLTTDQGGANEVTQAGEIPLECAERQQFLPLPCTSWSLTFAWTCGDTKKVLNSNTSACRACSRGFPNHLQLQNTACNAELAIRHRASSQGKKALVQYGSFWRWPVHPGEHIDPAGSMVVFAVTPQIQPRTARMKILPGEVD